MAVVLKNTNKDVPGKNLRLVPNAKKLEKIEYEFPYDDMYLLYEHIMKEKRE